MVVHNQNLNYQLLLPQDYQSQVDSLHVGEIVTFSKSIFRSKINQLHAKHKSEGS